MISPLNPKAPSRSIAATSKATGDPTATSAREVDLDLARVILRTYGPEGLNSYATWRQKHASSVGPRSSHVISSWISNSLRNLESVESQSAARSTGGVQAEARTEALAEILERAAPAATTTKRSSQSVLLGLRRLLRPQQIITGTNAQSTAQIAQTEKTLRGVKDQYWWTDKEGFGTLPDLEKGSEALFTCSRPGYSAWTKAGAGLASATMLAGATWYLLTGSGTQGEE